MKMQIPKGMTEKDVLQAIENVVNSLARSFKFGYFDVDDMKQQGRMYALQGIENYKPEIGPLENFLRSHVRNRYLNLKRNKLTRHQPPCVECPFYDPKLLKSKNKCAEFVDKRECDKFAGWEDRNFAKRNLVEPLDISNIKDERERNMRRHEDVGNDMDLRELKSLIDAKLPVCYRADYNRMCSGVHVPKQQRLKIIETIKMIISENYNGEAWEDV